MRAVQLDVEATDGFARTGRLHLPKGSVETPTFMPVGTRAAVKHLTSDDLDELGAEIVLGNTYHLMLRPGVDIVEDMGGLASFQSWPRHTLTDSGGYQILSLEPKITEEGATFFSTYDGDEVFLSPEKAVEVQQAIGADIQMVLDICSPLPSSEQVIRGAMEQTLRWAERARAVHTRPDQALFGIVQGGVDVPMRIESAQRTVEIGFDGYGIGGLSVGEERDQMLPAIAAAAEHLPRDRPRYVMGLGDPAGLLGAVANGADIFDCVLPTRLARHGTALTSEGRLNLKNARFATADEPLDVSCPHPASQQWSRAYVRHLLVTKEPTAARILTLHNLAWLFHLVSRVRHAIRAGTFDELRREVLEVWG
ncbi:MAG: tRNA guanosine(34) transglycosylase Tgt [Actinomycetia bacterium]|nr:tRNA guanosine(34) transglycosylase Tgt [Actinomycetes bacterium]